MFILWCEHMCVGVYYPILFLFLNLSFFHYLQKMCQEQLTLNLNIWVVDYQRTRVIQLEEWPYSKVDKMCLCVVSFT